MENTIDQLKTELLEVQKRFETLLQKVKEYDENVSVQKETKMLICKSFFGNYVTGRDGESYRRTEVDGSIVWEYLDVNYSQWFVVDDNDNFEQLEKFYLSDCLDLN